MPTNDKVEVSEFDGVIFLRELAETLRASEETIRRAVKAGRFPIAPLDGIDNRLRWWGPSIKRWLDGGGSFREEGE